MTVNQACIDCHFFIMKTVHHDGPLEISLKRRDSIRRADFSVINEYSVIACSRGIWNEAYAGTKKDASSRTERLLQTERVDKCYFFQFTPGMLLPAAEDLEERARQNESPPSKVGVKPYRVFISYSWSNSAERHALQSTLSKIPSVELLVDKDYIQPGDSVHDSIGKAILSADCVVALLTSEALKSREVADELTRCHDREKFIIPVIEEGTSLEAVPWYLRDTSYIAYNGKNFDQVVDRIIDAVKGRISPLSEIADCPARLKSLIDSGATFIEVPSSEAIFSAVPMEEYRICELRMHESAERFVFRAAARMCTGSAAEYLARRLLPHFGNEQYDWRFVHEEMEIGSYQTFETAGLRTGAELHLIGKHRVPTVSPKMGN